MHSYNWRAPLVRFRQPDGQERSGMIFGALESWLKRPVTHVQGEWLWCLMNPPQPPVDKAEFCVDTRQPDSTPFCLLFSLSLFTSLVASRSLPFWRNPRESILRFRISSDLLPLLAALKLNITRDVSMPLWLSSWIKPLKQIVHTSNTKSTSITDQKFLFPPLSGQLYPPLLSLLWDKVISKLYICWNLCSTSFTLTEHSKHFTIRLVIQVTHK